jgi:hypothetical protein
MQITKANVQKFLSDFKEGSLKPFLKSEEVPADNTGPVKVRLSFVCVAYVFVHMQK